MRREDAHQSHHHALVRRTRESSPVAFDCRVGSAFAGAILLAAVLSSASAFAHHGWGGYLDQTTDISGTVELPVSMAGPHATMKIRAEGGLPFLCL